MTRRELQTALEDDDFVLALLTSALTADRRLEFWSAEHFRRQARPEPIQYLILLREESGLSIQHSLGRLRRQSRSEE